jgi:hypothetical protein
VHVGEGEEGMSGYTPHFGDPSSSNESITVHHHVINKIFYDQDSPTLASASTPSNDVLSLVNAEKSVCYFPSLPSELLYLRNCALLI